MTRGSETLPFGRGRWVKVPGAWDEVTCSEFGRRRRRLGIATSMIREVRRVRRCWERVAVGVVQIRKWYNRGHVIRSIPELPTVDPSDLNDRTTINQVHWFGQVSIQLKMSILWSAPQKVSGTGITRFQGLNILLYWHNCKIDLPLFAAVFWARRMTWTHFRPQLPVIIYTK